MAAITLHANNRDEVSSASSIEVLLGNPSQRLMIFSGIARPELKVTDDDHNYPFDVEVLLDRHVSAIQSATVQVGLASIFNEETAFVFAVDSAVLDMEGGTGELKLRVHAVVRGDVSTLHRFSYQIVARVTKVAARISGTIKVPKSIVDVSTLAQNDLDALMRVSANKEVPVVPDPNGFPPLFQNLVPVAAGRLVRVRSQASESFVDYEIDNCPFGLALYVDVDRGAELIRQRAFIAQVAGPRPVTLTNFVPEQEGVDFLVMKGGQG